MTTISDFLHVMIGKYLLLVIKQAQMINCMSCKPQMINQFETAKLNVSHFH